MTRIELNRRNVTARLEREGWICHHGGEHDVYKHPEREGRIIVPRHRTLTIGVARDIARKAQWL
jgi:predicted RNA binding protein YcfA (HicA-like mRNA interferase family)